MPVVTLTTDFGEGSPYAAALKARVLRACPTATLVDVSHSVPPFDVEAGAFLLWAGTREFGWEDSVHLGVVDPGVGSGRRALALQIRSGARYVGPDNGLFEFVFRHLEVARVVELPVPPDAWPTFHGRDLFAPAAGRLAAGADLEELGSPVGDPVRLPEPGPRVIWVDGFGNLVTTLQRLPAGLRVGGLEVWRAARTFSEAPFGEPFLYVGSLGYVEVGLREGRAADLVDVGAGASIEILDDWSN